jgi:hypothetical protein
VSESPARRLLRRVNRAALDAALTWPSLYAPFIRVLGHDAASEGRLDALCLKQAFLPVPVHFYQPVPDVRDLVARGAWGIRSELTGIDWRTEAQLEMLSQLGREYGMECAWPANPTGDDSEFYTDNGGFSYGCAASTHMLIRYLRPKIVIEIGSGNSSRVIAAAVRANGVGRHVIIDPYPGAGLRGGLLGPVELISARVEVQDPAIFDDLAAGDVLFIDSGHTVRIGGDVNFEFLQVLPRLKPGVVVHIHDIHMPYEYPAVYATQHPRYFWTEQYLLQAFLTLNPHFEVLLAMHYLERDHGDAFARALPLYDPSVHKLVGSSFWMRRRS